MKSTQGPLKVGNYQHSSMNEQWIEGENGKFFFCFASTSISFNQISLDNYFWSFSPHWADWVGQLFFFATWVGSSFRKVTQIWWSLVCRWWRMISCTTELTLIQCKSLHQASHSKDAKRSMSPQWGLQSTCSP
jgi:hypothetical protein